jgi:hypothetical protein
MAAGQPSQTCHHHAYTYDSSMSHYSLIKNDSYSIGNNLIIESNCDISLTINQLTISSNEILIQQIPIDTKSFTITINNQTHDYQNLTFYPSDSIDFFYIDNPDDDKTKTESEMFTSEILAHAITTIILFTFSTTLVYRAAQSRIDNTIEVVI